MRRALVFSLLLLTLSDCAFVRLKNEVARINKAAWVLGVVEGETDSDAPMSRCCQISFGAVRRAL